MHEPNWKCSTTQRFPAENGSFECFRVQRTRGSSECEETNFIVRLIKESDLLWDVLVAEVDKDNCEGDGDGEYSVLNI